MTSHVAWNDIRTEHVERAGGEAAVEAGKRELLAEVVGPPGTWKPSRWPNNVTSATSKNAPTASPRCAEPVA